MVGVSGVSEEGAMAAGMVGSGEMLSPSDSGLQREINRSYK